MPVLRLFQVLTNSQIIQKQFDLAKGPKSGWERGGGFTSTVVFTVSELELAFFSGFQRSGEGERMARERERERERIQRSELPDQACCVSRIN